MPRPETLHNTLASLRRNLVGCDFKNSTLIINIDPMVGAGFDEERQRCVDIANGMFARVICNRPNTPNFALAVRWVWSQATDEFIIHWEDDWELCTEIDAVELIALMQQHRLDHVLLRAWRWRNYQFCLGPGILRRVFYRRCADVLSPSRNPEMAIRAMIVNSHYAQHVHPADCDQVVVRDLGRAWMRSSDYVRGDGDFVSWQLRTGENAHIDQRLADQNAELLQPTCTDHPTLDNHT